MRMSNYLGVDALLSAVMATSNRSLGIAHLTVVPTNARGESSTDDGTSETDAGDDGSETAE